jgi:hypothetical protein
MRHGMWAVLLVCFAVVTSAQAADDWNQQSPSSKPSARESHAMAYIGGDEVLLFGGTDGSLDDETWVYDLSGGTWTQRFPSSKPSARYDHAMTYIGGDQVLLFGGYDGSVDDETWVYDLSENTWTQQSPSSSPSVRSSHAMAYIGGDQVLLFGGYPGCFPLDDQTWVYDVSDGTWTQQSPSSKPSARERHAMQYIGGDQVLLFGGFYSPTYYDDTWLYDLSAGTWTQQSPSLKPSARGDHAMAYLGGDQVLLFGGYESGGTRDDETWAYDLSANTWTQDANTIQPSARSSHVVVAASADGSNYLLLFGGNDGSRDDETWTFGGGDFSLYAPDAPEAAVTCPNGGEIMAGSVSITWTATDPDPWAETALLLIDLDYSDDAGATWSSIASDETNDGSYSWDVSGVADGDQYLVRVTATDTTSLADCDTSDAVFRVYNPNAPHVTVTYPNGGERFVYSAPILWAATDADSGETALLLIDLDYSDNAGTSWSPIASGEANDGTYLWDVSGLPDGDNYLLRVTATDTSSLAGCDSSDAVFSVDNTGHEDWTQQWPSSKPSGRYSHAMAHAGGDLVLLFGGNEGGAYDDETWVYDLSAGTWTQQSPLSKPSARHTHAMAYIGGDQVLLFGGYDTNGRDNETWVYDLDDATWTQQSPSSSPSARYRHAMAHVGGDQVVLFGGDDGSQDDETWVYDLSDNTWTQLFPATKPSTRQSHGIAHIGGDQVVLFGGYHWPSYLQETWIYDLSENIWTQQSPSSKPSSRSEPGMAHIGEDRVLLFGGADNYGVFGDTWVYDLSDGTWTQDPNAIHPSARQCPALAATSLDGSNYLVLFGGNDLADDDETWTFGGGDYSLYAPDAPEAAVTYPNGGELLAGSATITWTAADPDPWAETALLMIDLDYSDDAGASWSSIASDEINDGSYLWDVSGLTDGDQYLVRITATDTTALADSDTSDAVFYIDNNPQAPQVGVTYPNGGEIVADSAVITWTATDPDPGQTALLLIDLDYSDDGGATWSAVASDETNDDSYVWDVSGLSDGDDYLVRITATDTTALADCDSSDTVFSVDNDAEAPQAAVTYPNGGESLIGTVAVTWTASDPDPGQTALLLIDLDYSGDAGASWSSIASDEANDGSYLWDVSGLPPGVNVYLLRVVATDTTGLFDADTSDAAFTVNDPRPSIVSVEDVPNDQGRQVAVLWERSYLDDPAYHVITYYSVWREYPYGDAIEDLYDEWDGSALDSLEEPVYRTLPDGSEGGQVEYWEFLGTVPAHFFEEYCYLAPTLADSSSSGIPYFTYLVSAHTADPYVFYDSAPDSGYSVDNTTPAKTTVTIRFQGGCAPGTVRLTWDVVTTGVDGTLELIPVDYRVYRSRDPNFQRPPATLVTTTSDLMYGDTDPLIGDPTNNLYYYVTAVDGSDNESDPSNAVGEFDWGAGAAATGKASSQQQGTRTSGDQ